MIRDCLDRLRDNLGGGPLTRRDAPLWAAASSLPDLCELTARWLEGGIDSQPGYYGTVDVDEDEAPGLTATLIRLNRAGFLTSNSQAGFDGVGHDGRRWQQLAAVDGYAEAGIADAVERMLDGTRFRVLTWRGAGPRWGAGGGVPVTFTDGAPFTRFGSQLSAPDLRDVYGGCGPDAIDAVCAATQLCVYDPQPGPNSLWPALRRL